MKYTTYTAFSLIALTRAKITTDKSEASSFLRHRSKRGILDTIDVTGEFTTMEAWENWKDKFEGIGVPEGEIDRLESCVSRCYWKDHMLDFVGQAYEENRETYE